MSRKSRLALGAQIMRLGFSGVLIARLPDHILDIKFFSEPRIKLPETDFDFGSQLSQCIYALQQLATELFLRSFGQRRGLGNRQFKCLNHGSFYITILVRRNHAPAGSKASWCHTSSLRRSAAMMVTSA